MQMMIFFKVFWSFRTLQAENTLESSLVQACLQKLGVRHIQANGKVFINNQGFISSQEEIMWSAGHPWQYVEKDQPWLTRRVGWRIKRGWRCSEGWPMTWPSKAWSAYTVGGHRVSTKEGNGQIWALQGGHVMHSDLQEHSTGGLPHFQMAGWGRGASLLLARSKTKWYWLLPTCCKALGPGSYYLPPKQDFICIFCRASLPICGKNIFFWLQLVYLEIWLQLVLSIQ